MNRDYLCRITTAGKSRDVVIYASNTDEAKMLAVETYKCDSVLVLRDLSLCEACGS